VNWGISIIWGSGWGCIYWGGWCCGT